VSLVTDQLSESPYSHGIRGLSYRPHHWLEADMGQVYFHCSHTQGLLIDRRGACVADLIEAREEAARVVRSLLATPTLQDWRGWVLHVSDEEGDEVFVLPFASMLGKPH
jgi:uncharacterized protein DUF6894